MDCGGGSGVTWQGVKNSSEVILWMTALSSSGGRFGIEVPFIIICPLKEAVKSSVIKPVITSLIVGDPGSGLEKWTDCECVVEEMF